MKISIDDIIGDFIMKLKIFKDIHPNSVSIIGICLNFIILYCALNNGSNHIIASLLLLRCMADILDGKIARKYNKKSELGGWLDTIQDMMLICFVIPFILLYKYTKNKLISILIPLTLTFLSLFLFYYNNVSDHDNIDSEFIQAFRNNSIIVFIIFIILN